MADSYLSIAAIAADKFMAERVTAAATQQQHLGSVDLSPWGPPQYAVPFNAQAWTVDNRYLWAASPSWGEKWSYALASHPDDPDYSPGKDDAVITDADILATVQALAAPAAE